MPKLITSPVGPKCITCRQMANQYSPITGGALRKSHSDKYAVSDTVIYTQLNKAKNKNPKNKKYKPRICKKLKG